MTNEQYQEKIKVIKKKHFFLRQVRIKMKSSHSIPSFLLKFDCSFGNEEPGN